jgi:ribosomal protein S27E
MPEVKCPNCGETTTINDLEDMEKEVFTCPFCHAAMSTDDL